MVDTPSSSQQLCAEDDKIKLPLKRTIKFTLSHPSNSSLLKKRRKEESTGKKEEEESIGKKEPTYNESMLEEHFGKDNVTNIKFKNTDVNGFSVKYVFKNFILKLNNGNEMDCYMSVNGALAIFKPLLDDIKTINNVLRFFIEKLGVNTSAHTVVEMDENSSALFSRPDRLTTYWNKEGQRIDGLPKTCFRGKVALKIMGAMWYQIDGNEEKPRIKVFQHLEQVQVIKSGCQEDNGEERSNTCIFN
jgi:hypothetical protein